MKLLRSVIALSLTMILFGCSKQDLPIVAYEDLKQDDVLIIVNDNKLTKHDVEALMSLDFALLAHSGTILSPAAKKNLEPGLAQRRRNQFIPSTLLTAVAKSAGIVASSNDIEHAWAELEEMYGKEGVTNSLKRFAKKLKPADRACLENDVNTAARIYAYLDNVGKDKVIVTEKEIDEVVKHGSEMQKMSERTMKEQRAKADKIYERLKNGEPFEKIAEISDTASDDNNCGEWGDFTPAVVESMYPGMVVPILNLKVGEFTPPMEMEDGIHIVRVKSRAGGGNESVVTIEPLHMELQRIVIKLPVLYVQGTREQIFNELKKQKQQKFQKEEVLPKLFKSADISYPSGKIRFKPLTKKENKK